MNAEPQLLHAERPDRSQVEEMRRGLVQFAMRVLRPVLRVLLRGGLSYPELNQICRWLCVDITMNEQEFFIPRRRRQFKARVACITALSRKEVLRLYSCPRPERNPELRSHNRAHRVLEGWLHDPAYRDESGRPLAIPFRAGDGRRSFSALVGEYSGDIPPRAILDELLRVGCCEMLSEDEVRLRHPVYAFRTLDPERLEEAGRIAARTMSEVDLLLSPDTQDAAPAPRKEAESVQPALQAL